MVKNYTLQNIFTKTLSLKHNFRTKIFLLLNKDEVNLEPIQPIEHKTELQIDDQHESQNVLPLNPVEWKSKSRHKKVSLRVPKKLKERFVYKQDFNKLWNFDLDCVKSK